MKLTTIDGKFVLLEFKGQESRLEKLSAQSRSWIKEMIDGGFSWGGFFIIDKKGNKKWGGGWELKAQWNKHKWKRKFKRNKKNAKQKKTRKTITSAHRHVKAFEDLSKIITPAPRCVKAFEDLSILVHVRCKSVRLPKNYR